MEYVVLDFCWGARLGNTKMEYDIKQIAAVHINERGHTVSTFYRLNEREHKLATQIKYMLELEEDMERDLEIAWTEFKQWLPENTVFLVWNMDIEKIVHSCNEKYRGKRVRGKFVDLHKLYNAAVSGELEKTSLADAMERLELTCKTSYVLSSLYRVQCMLRLYRKLWKKALKEMEHGEWQNLLLRGRFAVLEKLDLFAGLRKAATPADDCKLMKDFCLTKKYDYSINGTEVEITGKQAKWKFDLKNKGTDLVYIPVRYLQIPRRDMQLKAKNVSKEDAQKEILARIEETEARLGYGLGCAEVENLMARVRWGMKRKVLFGNVGLD